MKGSCGGKLGREAVESSCGGRLWREAVEGSCGGKLRREAVEAGCGGKLWRAAVEGGRLEGGYWLGWPGLAGWAVLAAPHPFCIINFMFLQKLHQKFDFTKAFLRVGVTEYYVYSRNCYACCYVSCYVCCYVVVT